MLLSDYKTSLFLGIFGFILLNVTNVAILLQATTNPYFDGINLISTIIGLLSIVGALILAIKKNQELNPES